MKMISILVVASLLFPLNILAKGYVKDTKITSIYCGYPSSFEMCSITFDKPIIAKDDCHTLAAERMQFKPDTAIGKAVLSIALSAQATQQKVDIHSTGTCNIYSGIADMNRINIKSN